MTTMTQDKEQRTREERVARVQENIAEIGKIVGQLASTGSFPHSDLEISTTESSQSIIQWANEFEELYPGPEYDYSKGVPELGNPLGYIDAIDNFTDLKMREAGWLTVGYINDKARFWHGSEYYYVDIEFRVTNTIKVLAANQDDADAQARTWWEQASLEEATAGATDFNEFCVREIQSVADSEKYK